MKITTETICLNCGTEFDLETVHECPACGEPVEAREELLDRAERRREEEYGEYLMNCERDEY